MNRELQQALDDLVARQSTVNVFFRDDDADQDIPALRHLVAAFQSKQIPLNLAVIPQTLTEAGAALLRRLPASLFELNQHGWRHVNHEATGRKCEFGPSRGFAEQLADIAKGQARLDELFGDRWARVFTPPWNRCTEETFRALDQLGFVALSKDRGNQPVTGYRFREISITLDVYRWKGEPAMKSPESIFNELARQVRELDTVGILLHHKAMDETAFAFIAELLETLSNHPCVRFHTFQSLLQAEREARATAV